jgi:LPS sulfotransferase NodH
MFNIKKLQMKIFLQNTGLLPATHQYTKFIILGRSRTGSNFLRGLLSSHPEILTAGEILRNPDQIDWDSDQYYVNAQVLNLYQQKPIEFMQKIVFRKFPPQIKAVGFKLFYYHAQTEPYNQIWDFLKKSTEIRIIHIKRENILKTHLSRAQANRSGSWVNTSGKKEDHGPITLDPVECLKDFEQTRQWENYYDQFFASHLIKQVRYEDLANNYEAIIQDIQTFLNVSPHPVKPQTYKQSSKHLSEMITNYDELKSKFKDTPWAKFFGEN